MPFITWLTVAILAMTVLVGGGWMVATACLIAVPVILTLL